MNIYEKIFITIALAVCFLVTKYIVETEISYREAVAYQAGYVAGQSKVTSDLKEREDQIAMQWWAGTKDLIAVRNRMCSNVSKNAFK